MSPQSVITSTGRIITVVNGVNPLTETSSVDTAIDPITGKMFLVGSGGVGGSPLKNLVIVTFDAEISQDNVIFYIIAATPWPDIRSPFLMKFTNTNLEKEIAFADFNLLPQNYPVRTKDFIVTRGKSKNTSFFHFFRFSPTLLSFLGESISPLFYTAGGDISYVPDSNDLFLCYPGAHPLQRYTIEGYKVWFSRIGIQWDDEYLFSGKKSIRFSSNPDFFQGRTRWAPPPPSYARINLDNGMVTSLQDNVDFEFEDYLSLGNEFMILGRGSFTNTVFTYRQGMRIIWRKTMNESITDLEGRARTIKNKLDTFLLMDSDRKRIHRYNVSDGSLINSYRFFI